MNDEFIKDSIIIPTAEYSFPLPTITQTENKKMRIIIDSEAIKPFLFVY